ncbi:hypothetical protein [Intestinibacter sp.]|nr:hypothetical protein [Intestinibacter sp.]MDY5212944.1 hypothetical protein [Intestinibacter sp.]
MFEFGLPLNIFSEEGKKDKVRTFFFTGFIKNMLANIKTAIM